MTDGLRWGVLLPTFDQFGTGQPPPVVASARRAEELGFDAVWVGDHLVCPAPGLDSLCSLSAAAAVTSRVELGVSVLQLGLRHLVWTAKQLATIDALAPGRLRLGVGVGGEFEDEFVAAGVARGDRGRRLDEMLEILPPLLLGQAVDHAGTHVKVSVPGLRPAMTAPPPVSVGGRSRAALVRTARYADQWMAMWHDAATVRELGQELAELAAGNGRTAGEDRAANRGRTADQDRAADQGRTGGEDRTASDGRTAGEDRAWANRRTVPSVAMLVLVNVNEDIGVARDEAAAALNGQYRLPLRVVDRWTAYGPAEQVAKMLADYRDAGVGEFALLPAAPDPLGQYERLAAVRDLVDSGQAQASKVAGWTST